MKLIKKVATEQRTVLAVLMLKLKEIALTGNLKLPVIKASNKIMQSKFKAAGVSSGSFIFHAKSGSIFQFHYKPPDDANNS